MTATDPASGTALGQHTADRDDRVLPLTRAVSLAVIPFLVLASAALYPVPGDAGRFFAWPIKPAITPMILASVYIGGAYFFARAGAVFLFVFPGQAVRIWPWALTPLTAQVMGAIFALGGAGLGVLADRRWTSARILFQVAAMMLVLILIGGARAYGEFRPSDPMTWLLGAEFTAGLATSTILYARMQARAGQASRDMGTGAEPQPGTLSPCRCGA
jgi:hypothetical protein